jgi:hypothetical protein
MSRVHSPPTPAPKAKAATIVASAPLKAVRDQGPQVACAQGAGVFDTVQRPERRYLRRCDEGDGARSDPAGYPAARSSDGSQDDDLGNQDPSGRTPDDPANRRLSQDLSESHSEHERDYRRNVEERSPPVASLSVNAEQHDIARLRVGEYSVVTDKTCTHPGIRRRRRAASPRAQVPVGYGPQPQAILAVSTSPAREQDSPSSR